MFNVLIVEDDVNTLRYMQAVLKMHGYQTYLAHNGEEALEVMDSQHVDLIIVDVMMPKLDGYQFVDILRQSNNELPILMVTAKLEMADKKKGFLVGIDDYMTKPVNEEEMLLRIKALLRRSKIVSEHRIIIGDVILDYDALTVKRREEVQELPPKEFYLLYKLLSYPKKIFTRFQLMDEIWGMDSDAGDTTVNVHINRLRKRFEHFNEFEIITVRGLGYKAVKYEKE